MKDDLVKDMGTCDIYTYETPCRCGAGKFIKQTFSGDYHVWYSQMIRCEKCAEIYRIERRYGYDGAIFIVLIQALKESQKERDMLSNQFKNLLQTDEGQHILKDFETLMNQQSYITDIHRLLIDAEIIYECSISSFRRYWKKSNNSADLWIKDNVEYSNFLNIMRLVGNNNIKIINEINKIDTDLTNNLKSYNLLGEDIPESAWKECLNDN
jgi:hypothetical protein